MDENHPTKFLPEPGPGPGPEKSDFADPLYRPVPLPVSKKT